MAGTQQAAGKHRCTATSSATCDAGGRSPLPPQSEPCATPGRDGRRQTDAPHRLPSPATAPPRHEPLRGGRTTRRDARHGAAGRRFSKKMRHAWGTEIERTAPRYPATAQKSAGSVKLFYAFRPKTDGLGATTCHACPLPRSRLRCAATKRGAPTVLLKHGSGQMMLPMTPADGKTERERRKMQALLRRQHGHDRQQHGLLSEIQGHDWLKHAADAPQHAPRTHRPHSRTKNRANTAGDGTGPQQGSPRR